MLEKKIQELGRLVLGGDVVFALDAEMVLDRVTLKVYEAQSVLGDSTWNDVDARYLAAELLGVEVPANSGINAPVQE